MNTNELKTEHETGDHGLAQGTEAHADCPYCEEDRENAEAAEASLRRQQAQTWPTLYPAIGTAAYRRLNR